MKTLLSCIIFFLFFIIYMLHVHISCVLFFYFLSPDNVFYKENYDSLTRIFKKVGLKK